MSKKLLGIVSAILVLTSSLSQVAFATQSTAPSATDITVVNNVAGALDKVTVKSLASGDTVDVYATAKATTPLGTVVSTGTSADVYINQLGATAGNAYVSVTKSGSTESERTPAAFVAEPSTTAPTTISISNNKASLADSIDVTCSSGDIVRVYKAKAGTVILGAGIAGATGATINVAQLGAIAGKVYISVQKSAYLESARTEKEFGAEVTASTVLATAVKVQNNKVGVSDTVTVSSLTSGDIVNVYDKAAKGTLLGTATATGATVSISIAQVGVKSGSVYVALEAANKNEGKRTMCKFDSETSIAPKATTIAVTNSYTGIKDVVTVTGGVNDGDVITVYGVAKDGTALGTATATSTGATISIADLIASNASGSAYITITGKNMLESLRTAKPYTKAVTTDALASEITVTNGTGATDSISVTNCVAGEIVKIYDAASGGKLLGTSAAVGTGATTATISLVKDLGASGTVYINKTGTGAKESSRTAKTFLLLLPFMLMKKKK